MIERAAAQTTAPVVSAVYTASDFRMLSRGVDPGVTGEVAVSAWATTQDDWSLKAGEDGTITLTVRSKPGDSSPRWQSLGTVTLEAGPATQGRRGRAGRAEDAHGRADEDVIRTRRRSTSRTRCPRSCGLPCTSDPGEAAEVSLDIVRGRVDSVAPSPDRRRGEVRTNYQGADFQAPATAEAWRDRAGAPPRADCSSRSASGRCSRRRR